MRASDVRDRSTGLPTRPTLLADLADADDAATLVVCRIDEPEAIIDGHGAPVLERVVVALALLLKGTFGTDVKVYRTSTQCVAMFLPRLPARQVAQQMRKVQARVAPEYEYERHGVTRRVVFTFSSVLMTSAGKTPDDAVDALTRAEARAESLAGLSQLEVEASGLGRLVGWLSSTGL